MSSTDYRRKSTSREDPRLAARRESTSIYDDLDGGKSKPDSPRAGASRDPRIREDSATWRGHEQGYNQQMQTAYQHLPTAVYPDQYSQGYQGGYPGYQQNYNAAYQYPGYGQSGYGMPGTEYPHPQGWVPATGYAPPPPQPQQQQQQPQQMTSGVNSHVNEGKKDGVAQEIKHQKTQLIKQREEYVKKIKVLRRELEALRKQQREFLSEKSPERDTEHILIENNNLQTEIRNKLKALSEVVEMLSSLIRDNQSLDDLERQFASVSPSSSRSRERNHKPPTSERFDETQRYDYQHYDPELHWCRTCDVFPKTAKELLLHLQSEEHRKVAKERGMKDDTPWHHNLSPEPQLPSFEGAPVKRLPIKGLQFFIPAPSWYCKLCDTWIGDLHCASKHLKSQTHFQNYSHFVDQNPHWELEWLKDREKALARVKHGSSDSEDVSERRRKFHKDKQLFLENISKEKKKKKRSKKRRRHSSDSSSSSSSSSDSSSEDEDDAGDKSRSIRVAMRNVKVQQMELGGKWEMLGRLVEDRKQKEREVVNNENQQEDRLINQWMTVSEPKEKDKQLLDGLKDRMKQKHEAEKIRQAELERKQKERELKEKEEQERQERQQREAKEREEQQRKERERQELERIRDKERERVKLKTRDRENYRKRGDSESSKDYDRSPSMERKRSRHSPHRRRENGRSSHDRRHSPSPNKHDKKPPPPPSYKKLPFIGRMPLFKNKKPEEKVQKEIKKEDYDIPRQTRFEPGHLSRAFIPEPEVVCFPKLSTIPPISMPMQPPEPPKISEPKPPKAPPPPKIGEKEKEKAENKKEEEKKAEEKGEKKQAPTTNNDYGNYRQMMMDSNAMAQYYDYSMMYQQQYDYQDIPLDEVPPEISGEVPPLQPPPLPPDDPNDDLAMLGISVDDMAAQSF